MCRIINSDGTEAEMCGNGIRCLASYLYNESIGSIDVGNADTNSSNNSNNSNNYSSIGLIFNILTVTGRIMTCEVSYLHV